MCWTRYGDVGGTNRYRAQCNERNNHRHHFLHVRPQQNRPLSHDNLTAGWIAESMAQERDTTSNVGITPNVSFRQQFSVRAAPECFAIYENATSGGRSSSSSICFI